MQCNQYIRLGTSMLDLRQERLAENSRDTLNTNTSC